LGGAGGGASRAAAAQHQARLDARFGEAFGGRASALLEGGVRIVRQG
jgi:hypothetical protein